MSDIAVLQPQPRQVIQVIDPIPVLDTGRFEQMQRIARIMANASLTPDALRKIKEGDKLVDLHPDEIFANCFQVTNQAVRWGMDPFAVAQCVSIVKGKLCFEGKLVAAVLDAKLGVRLQFTWDNKTGDDHGIVVSGTLPDETEPRTISGTVRDWKTTGPGSPWATPQGAHRQLAYRGSREWGRIHAPAIMLGVYTQDEMEDLQNERRSSQFRSELPPVDVTPSRRLPPAPPPAPSAATPAPAASTVTPGPAPKGPPGPPPPPPAAKPIEEFDFDRFRAAVMAAPTQEDADTIYNTDVALRKPPLSEDELSEVDNIYREACARFWSSDDGEAA